MTTASTPEPSTFGVRACVLGGLSGLMWAASIPRPGLWLLGWLALVPLFVARARVPRRQLFAVGLTCGLVAGFARVYWLAETLARYGQVPWLAAWLTTAALIAYLALYPAFFLHISAKFPFGGPVFAPAAAALWTVFDWAQQWVISGIPWELLGYSQMGNRTVRQVAALTGVHGLSFLLVFVSAAATQAIVGSRQRGRRLAEGCLLLALALGYGNYRLKSAPPPVGRPLRIAILQGNVEQDQKWRRDGIADATKRYVALADSVASEPLDLIVFPETALPFRLNGPSAGPDREALTELARRSQAALMVGSLAEEPGPTGPELFNRVFLYASSGHIVDHAEKVHLVPFGEYLPWPRLSRYLQGLTAESGVFAPGERHHAMALPGTEVRVGTFLCFEAVFPEITRKLVRDGATLLVTQTNDAWFGRSAAPYQHFSMAAMRAVETGRPLVRVANTGISGLVSAQGDTVVASELFTKTAFVVTTYPESGTTLYVRFGEWLVLLSAAFLLALSLVEQARRDGTPASSEPA